MTDPFMLEWPISKLSDGHLRRRVIRGGPYTKDNRKELGHHLVVGAGIGGSAGAATGAHVGAYLHGRDTRMMHAGEKLTTDLALHHRGKAALVAAGLGAGLGAGYGAYTGAAVAAHARHNRSQPSVKGRKKPVSKADHPHAAEAAGGAAGVGAYQAGGYKMKLVAQRKGSKAPAGVSRSKYEKTIKEHQRAHGAYHGGEPTWLGARGRLGHTVGLVTGQGPTAHVNAARHWPTKVEGVSVPGAKVRRVMGYTHGGKTGLATAAAVTALGAGGGLAAEHHHVKKSEPLAIAGKLWRRPTMRSEFHRAWKGTHAGEKVVGQASTTPKIGIRRDAWGYPQRHITGETHGKDARQALKTSLKHHAQYSPHRTSFKTGARAASTAAAVGRRPEYAISVPAVAGGGTLIHHEATKGKKKKGSTVAKSAITKYSPGAITYHQQEADMHARKRRSGRNQAATGVAVGGVSGALLHRGVADRVAMHAADIRHGEGHLKLASQKSPAWGRTAVAASRTARKVGVGGVAAGGALATVGVTRALHHGRQQNKQSKLAQRARVERNVMLADREVGKSAFGVVDERLEKNFLTSALETGVHALRGVKSGLGGAVGAERTAAGAHGKVVGSAVRSTSGKLVATKQRAAATAGVGGLGLGMSLSGKKNQ